MFTLDPKQFSQDAVSSEIAKQNADIVALMDTLPNPWDFPPELVRALRREGKGVFPPDPKVEYAEVVDIRGRGGKIPLRIVRPQTRPSRGVFLHIHGGGWVLGEADYQDSFLVRMAEMTGLTSVSVEYRLAPESPYPAGPDDCESAALWVIRNCKSEFNGDILSIGGESAGAHLSVVTLLRLRDRHDLTPFHSALLNAGCYDLNMTPSARAFGEKRLILRTSDIQQYVSRFLAGNGDRNDPDISPIFANLRGLPPALFTCGTRDALIDDTLLMASRWTIAGNGAEMDIVPGACHAFTCFKTAASNAAIAAMGRFANEHAGG